MRGLIDKLPRDRIELILILPAQVCTYVEIVTDYVRCGLKKRLTNFVLNAGALILTIATLAAIWHLHLAAPVAIAS